MFINFGYGQCYNSVFSGISQLPQQITQLSLSFALIEQIVCSILGTEDNESFLDNINTLPHRITKFYKLHRQPNLLPFFRFGVFDPSSSNFYHTDIIKLSHN